ncbi:MAG: hypothetical protein A3F10_02560 [Coxiella sp. RIFCSPHIGHO2_12_FULL_42_15]|nr:MAG: hypothetical protein A3F10_02560 [Coxiella sp. RIFCSPHIGHO2_12_FULL_42_15]
MNKKTICITGASSGIGAALAKYYAAEKQRLFLIARHQDRLNQLAHECRQQGAEVSVGIIDVSDADAMAVWLNEQQNQFPIDLLIINAGISTTQAFQTTKNVFQAETRLISVHLQGMLNTLSPVLEKMQQRGCGQIALMSSINAFISLPRNPMYGAVKNAVLHYGLALRNRLSTQNIKVNILCPGWIDTPLTAGNKFPMLFLRDVNYAVKKMTTGLLKNKTIIAFPWQLKWALTIFNWLPLSWRQAIARRVGA